jgi:hypothetical protein
MAQTWIWADEIHSPIPRSLYNSLSLHLRSGAETQWTLGEMAAETEAPTAASFFLGGYV